eukprot:3790481-Amphidinium_carterae.2
MFCFLQRSELNAVILMRLAGVTLREWPLSGVPRLWWQGAKWKNCTKASPIFLRTPSHSTRLKPQLLAVERAEQSATNYADENAPTYCTNHIIEA